MGSEGWKQRWWGLRSRRMAHLVPAGGEHPRLTPQGVGSSPLRGRGGGHSAHGPHAHTWLSHPQIWYLLEGSYHVYQLFPSKAWDVYINLQVLQQSSLYAPNETMVTLFYEDKKLYQVPRWGDSVGETWGSCRVADTSSRGLYLPTAAGVPDRQPAGQTRQEAHARGAATDIPADQ